MNLEKLKLIVELLKAKTDIFKMRVDNVKYAGVLKYGEWEQLEQLEEKINKTLNQLYSEEKPSEKERKNRLTIIIDKDEDGYVAHILEKPNYIEIASSLKAVIKKISENIE